MSMHHAVGVSAMNEMLRKVTNALNVLRGKKCPPGISVAINLDFSSSQSRTTYKTKDDIYKVKIDPSQLQLNGQANFGPWFLNGQLSFGGYPSGSFSDVFPAVPAANFSGIVNSGTMYDFTVDGGYNFIKVPGWSVGAFGGYYSHSEYMYGMTTGATGSFPVLSTHWQAARAGLMAAHGFFVGNTPFILMGSVTGLYDNLQSGTFNGNGGGVQTDIRLVFPLPNVPLVGNIFAQYTDMNASGNSVGVPMTVNNQNWAFGGGLSLAFGETAARAPAYPVKALPSK